MKVNNMDERFVISIKARKDMIGNRSEHWLYAGFDDGTYGSGYPCWCYSDRFCKFFESVKDAKEWFARAKSYLLSLRYEFCDLDIETLCIKKVVYEKVASL